MRRIPGAIALALTVAALGAACERSPKTEARPRVVLVGCLQPGDTPDTYRLANTAAPTGPVGTRGTAPMVGPNNPTGTAASSHTSDLGVADTRLYTLVGSKKVDLAQYQGAVVRITGDVERPGGNASGGGGSTGQAQGGANPTTGSGPQSSVVGPSPDRPEPRVRVDSVQRVAPDCATAK